MNIVAVKHSGKGKEYWFEVPENLVGRVKPGARVICNTGAGKRKAVVVSEVINDAAFQPTEKIEKVLDRKRIQLDHILVPWSFRKTRPSKNKLIARINEYYTDGEFQTNIEVDENGILRDGYTAWMVAKMLGVKYLTINV